MKVFTEKVNNYIGNLIKINSCHKDNRYIFIYLCVYASEFIHNMALGDTKTGYYQSIFDEEDSSNTHILQYFVIHVLVIVRMCECSYKKCT